MKKVLVIGCGNTLRADDGVGWHAAERIAAIMAAGEVAVLTCRQLTPELAEAVHTARRVIFIDASIADPPGIIRSHRLVPAASLPALPGHFLTPSSLLTLVKQVYGRTPPAVLVSVGARCFAFGESFSTEVSRSFPVLIDGLCGLIQSWAASEGQPHPREDACPSGQK